jgi:hypothetical protein
LFTHRILAQWTRRSRRTFPGEQAAITLYGRFRADDEWRKLRARLTRATAVVPTVSHVVLHIDDNGDSGSRASEDTDRLTVLPGRMAVLEDVDG